VGTPGTDQFATLPETLFPETARSAVGDGTHMVRPHPGVDGTVEGVTFVSVSFEHQTVQFGVDTMPVTFAAGTAFALRGGFVLVGTMACAHVRTSGCVCTVTARRARRPEVILCSSQVATSQTTSGAFVVVCRPGVAANGCVF
jgi:hypothetical protein